MLRHLDLRQITFAAVHVVTALADIAGNTCVFHFYHLFDDILPRQKRFMQGGLLFRFPFGFYRDGNMLDG